MRLKKYLNFVFIFSYIDQRDIFVLKGKKMEANQLIEEIDKLNLTEKLTLVEEIWDSIARSNSELPLPEWQKSELDKRYKEYKTGKLSIFESGTVHDEIRKKFK